MRISTAQMQQRAVDSMLDAQSKLAQTQQQVATGRKILKPSDDPSGAAYILDLKKEISVTERYQANASSANSRLALEDDLLGSVTHLLQRVRELTVLANNDTSTAVDRSVVAQEIYERVGELMGIANTRDAGGEYIFSGFQSSTQPFTHDGAGTFSYTGDQGQRLGQIGHSTQVAVNDSGARVFEQIRTGNGTFSTSPAPANQGTGVIDPGNVIGTFVPDNYTLGFVQALPSDPVTYEVRDGGGALVTGGPYQAGGVIEFNGARVTVTGDPADGDAFSIRSSEHQSIMETVHALADTLANSTDDGVGNARLHNHINQALVNLDNSLDHINEVRATVGARLNIVESQKDNNDGFLLQTREVLSGVQDLDYAEAVTRLNLQLTGLQASQQAYLKIQGLSLFRLMG